MKKFQRKVVMMFVATAALASVTAPASAATVWEILRSWTTNMSAVKDLLIYAFFLAGLGGMGWGGTDMYKKSKERGGEDVTWSGIGIKFLAGVLLVALTMTTDTFKSTVFGGSTTSTTTNIQ